MIQYYISENLPPHPTDPFRRDGVGVANRALIETPLSRQKAPFYRVFFGKTDPEFRVLGSSYLDDGEPIWLQPNPSNDDISSSTFKRAGDTFDGGNYLLTKHPEDSTGLVIRYLEGRSPLWPEEKRKIEQELAKLTGHDIYPVDDHYVIGPFGDSPRYEPRQINVDLGYFYKNFRLPPDGRVTTGIRRSDAPYHDMFTPHDEPISVIVVVDENTGELVSAKRGEPKDILNHPSHANENGRALNIFPWKDSHREIHVRVDPHDPETAFVTHFTMRNLPFLDKEVPEYLNTRFSQQPTINRALANYLGKDIRNGVHYTPFGEEAILDASQGVHVLPKQLYSTENPHKSLEVLAGVYDPEVGLVAMKKWTPYHEYPDIRMAFIPLRHQTRSRADEEIPGNFRDVTTLLSEINKYDASQQVLAPFVVELTSDGEAIVYYFGPEPLHNMREQTRKQVEEILGDVGIPIKSFEYRGIQDPQLPSPPLPSLSPAFPAIDPP